MGRNDHGLKLSSAGLIAARGASSLGKIQRGIELTDEEKQNLKGIAEGLERYAQIAAGGATFDYFRQENAFDVLAQQGAGLPEHDDLVGIILLSLVDGKMVDPIEVTTAYSYLRSIAQDINGRLSSPGEIVDLSNFKTRVSTRR